MLCMHSLVVFKSVKFTADFHSFPHGIYFALNGNTISMYKICWMNKRVKGLVKFAFS